MDQLPQRLKRLKQDIGLERRDLSPDSVSRTFAAHALRASIDMVAALAVGAALGYGIDRWLDTRPWFLMVGFIVGSAAGFLTIYRMVQRLMNDTPKE